MVSEKGVYICLFEALDAIFWHKKESALATIQKHSNE